MNTTLSCEVSLRNQILEAYITLNFVDYHVECNVYFQVTIRL